MTDSADRQVDRCSATNQQGDPCQAPPLHGSCFCFAHDPSKRDVIAEGRRKGGKTTSSRVSRRYARASDFGGKTAGEVAALLAETINQARTGEVDLKVATTVGYLANVLIRAREVAELEARVERIEKLVTARRRQSC